MSSTTTTTTTLPSDMPGTQETLLPGKQFDHSLSQFPWLSDVVKGTAHAFTVAGSPVFEVADQPPAGCEPAASTETEAEAIFYVGNGGLSGTVSPQMGCQPIAPPNLVHGSLVEIINSWPKYDQSVFVWPNLPTSVAYVTYSRNGRTSFWETPLDGTVGFLVPWPAVYDASFAQWHDAPIPVLRSYDAEGQLLATVKCPRITGDDEIRSRQLPGRG
jgi:hypothetical protein